MKFDYPRKPAKPLVMIFDVDGTLLKLRPGVKRIPYNDEEALRRDQVPHEAVVARAKSLEDAGFAIRFCSGRGAALWDLTVEQLEAAGFRDVAQRLTLQERYIDVDALVQFKADEHADWEAVLSIGDQDHDMHGALQAGTPFVHVDDFAAGHSLDHTFCWHCGCTALRACPAGCSWATGRLCSRCAMPGHAQLTDFQEALA